MTPTVVITGVAGFLGSHLLEQTLRLTDYNVVAVDSLRHNGTSLNVRDVFGDVPWHADRVKLICHDLRAPFHRTDLRSLVNVDYIIHAAAFSQVGHSTIDPVGFTKNNVHGALTMLEVARLSPKLRRFVLISTDEVYGAGSDSYGTGMTNYQPSSPYAASKACQELIAQAYQRSFRIPLTTFNISNMFGPRQSQLAFIPQVIRKLREGTIIDVHVDENGVAGGRHYSLVENVATNIVYGVQGDFNEYGPLHDRVHMPGHDYVDNDTLVRELHALARVKTSADHLIRHVRVHDLRPGHDMTYGRLAGDTNWLPQLPFADALALTHAWYTTHLEWLEA